MRRILYDLAAADDSVRFSPYCWRIKLAMAHKHLEFDTKAWRFSDKDEIAFSGQGKVPVLVDGDHAVHDSMAIAEYLEAKYPHEPSLFGDPQTRAMINFVKAWTEDSLQLAIARVVLPDLHSILHPNDQDYFRTTREKAFGTTIEDIGSKRSEYAAMLRATLTPLRTTLKHQPFLAGDSPTFADHIVYGALKWGVTVSSVPLLPETDKLMIWMKSLTDAYEN